MLRTFYGLVVDLRGSRQLITDLLYGETGVMDFDLYDARKKIADTFQYDRFNDVSDTLEVGNW